MKRVFVYDTTLRDGSQMEGVSFSLADRLHIVRLLDTVGVDYVEGGFPHSNPKERDFFTEVRKLKLKRARVAAFGATRKARNKVADDPSVTALLDAHTPVVCLVAKSWDLHVREVLRTSLEENLRMIEDTVRYFKTHRKEVILDAEHFFDGYKAKPDYAVRTLAAAVEAGADHIVLCDTNGGCLPFEIEQIIREVVEDVPVTLGIHAHNDTGCAVANTLAAVHAGARHVQGTINGVGERCGNADLCAVTAGLALKMNKTVLTPTAIKRLTEVSRAVSELANLVPVRNQPYVGSSAFSHKGGFHIHAVTHNPLTYEHINPESVGNERRILLSELSGQSTMLKKFERMKIKTDPETTRTILAALQKLENEGYQYEAAEASFELLARGIMGTRNHYFDLEGFRVIVERRNTDGTPVTEATVKLRVGDERMLMASEGDGPVDALDGAVRGALERFYPQIAGMQLVDYKVRVINPKAGTAARVRVIIASRDARSVWSTIGVSENLIEASWQALVDSIEYKLTKDRVPGR